MGFSVYAVGEMLVAFTKGNRSRIRVREREARQARIMLRMREARILCGASIQQVVEALGGEFHLQTIKDAELGIRPPTQRMRFALSDVYGVPENILFWDWDNIREYMVKKGGGLRRAIPEYKGRRIASGEVHRRVQENDD